MNQSYNYNINEFNNCFFQPQQLQPPLQQHNNGYQNLTYQQVDPYSFQQQQHQLQLSQENPQFNQQIQQQQQQQQYQPIQQQQQQQPQQQQLQQPQQQQQQQQHQKHETKPQLPASVNKPYHIRDINPKLHSLEIWNFSGETTSKIYQTLNQRAEVHKTSAHSRVVFVKKVYSWLASHDREYLKSHNTIDLICAISDILNMIMSLIELHRAPCNILQLIIYSSDRFVERTGINHHQIFNLLLTSSIVNLKFWNETLYIQNKTIADIFSFSVKDLNTMERRFLYGLDYNLCVSQEELNYFLDKIKYIK